MIKREDLLKALKNNKVDNGPKDNVKLDKEALVKELKSNFKPKISEESPHIQEEIPSEDLSNNLMMKNAWKPRTSMKDIATRVHVESASEMHKPNVFRLNIETLVLDKIHSKFKITRGPSFAIVEILYPNANDKISVKFQVEGVEDRIIEVGLEDEAYTRNFGIFIIRVVDEMLKQKQAINPSMEDLHAVDGVVGKTYTAPNVLSGQYPIWESVMSLMEADEIEEEKPEGEDDGMKAPTDFPNGVGGEGENAPAGGDVNAEGGDFGAEDFSMEGSPEGESAPGDLGAALGGGSTGGSTGGADMGSGAVNTTAPGEQPGEAESAPEFVKFRDKTDWLNDSLISMQKLVATDASENMQDGSGVVLTSDEVLNGTSGIKGDTNYDVVDKFLKVYPELDGIDIPLDMMDQIEDKLALDDGQFDSWLQAKLPEITGQTDVDETLGNEMFEDFKPMGGEQPKQPQAQPAAATPNAPEASGEEGSLDDFLKTLKSDEENTQDDTLRNDAELDVGGSKLNEFPNLGGEAPAEEEVPEEKKP